MAKILIVEPDYILARLYRQALTAKGHQIVVVATAQDAVFAADRQHPDLILLEVQLVGHSGIEFLYELRSYADWQRIPVVVLSNVPPAEFSGSQRLIEDELKIRAYHYKPLLTLKKLIASVEELLPDNILLRQAASIEAPA